MQVLGRTSQEVRGLKCTYCGHKKTPPPSHLARGAWIEILYLSTKLVSGESHLARGAWIEIWAVVWVFLVGFVAPRKRCVD